MLNYPVANPWGNDLSRGAHRQIQVSTGITMQATTPPAHTPAAPTPVVLIVEDDAEIFKLLNNHLCGHGYRVLWEHDGQKGLERALVETPSLCILDIQLPSLDGISICAGIRTSGATCPILMLTAKGDESDRILGLQAGADDYLCKPFGILELIARVQALLRRASQYSKAESAVQPENRIYDYGQLSLDLGKREVRRGTELLELTALEYDLLLIFCLNPGVTFTREQLLHDVWDYKSGSYESTVNTNITRLRKKIEPDPSNPTYIKTVWGVGYRGADSSELFQE